MTAEDHSYRDVAALVTQIAHLCPLTEGLALLAVVEDPSTTQQLIQLERLPVDARIDAHDEVRDLLRDTMRALPIPDFAGPDTRHSVLTVVVRPGRALLGPHEQAWLMGWRYSNHHRGAWDSELVVVTEHGWYEWRSDWAGFAPTMLAG